MKKDRSIIFVLAFLVAGFSHFAAAQTKTHQNVDVAPFSDPSCWDGPRTYQTGPENTRFMSLIKISSVGRKKLEQTIIEMEWLLGPNGTYKLTTMARDPKKADTNILLIDTGQSALLRLDIGESGQLGEEKWIDEKLIFFRIWWGRLRGTDVIFDVESGKIRLAEGVEDGTIAYREAKETCSLPDMKCPCTPH